MKYIPVINILAIEIFFSVSRLFSYQYGGRESSPVYLIYNVVLFILSVLIFLYNSFIKKCKYEGRHICILSIPLCISFFYLCSALFGSLGPVATEKFQFFLLWSVPSIYAGIYFSEGDRIKYLSCLLEVLMIIFTAAILLTTVETLNNGGTVSLGGASYQTASYIAAFAYGINLYYLFYGKEHKRFGFATSRIYKVLSIAMIFVQIVGVFTSGGRGGLILILVYTIYLCGSLFSKHNLRQGIRYITIVAVIITVLALIIPRLFQFDIFKFSFNRVFSYISSGGIDWEETSGRGEVYKRALEFIYRSPLIGYGIFGFWRVNGSYPHNIFLELLLNGGIIYLCYGLIFLTIMAKRYFWLVKSEPRLRIFGIIALYPLTMLQFSGTYLNEPLFWLSISAIFAFKVDEKIVPVSSKLIKVVSDKGYKK